MLGLRLGRSDLVVAGLAAMLSVGVYYGTAAAMPATDLGWISDLADGPRVDAILEAGFVVEHVGPGGMLVRLADGSRYVCRLSMVEASLDGCALLRRGD